MCQPDAVGLPPQGGVLVDGDATLDTNGWKLLVTPLGGGNEGGSIVEDVDIHNSETKLVHTIYFVMANSGAM